MTTSKAVAALSTTMVVFLLCKPTWTQASTQPAPTGSYQPPLAFVANDKTYAFGIGLGAFTDSLTIFGIVAGWGSHFGHAPHPHFGFETAIAGMNGSGNATLGTSPNTSTIDMNMSMANGSFTAKWRAVDPAGGGIFGVTIYGGPTLGFFQLGITNDHGTAYRHYLSMGAAAGALLQIIPRPLVEIMVFGGGRTLALLGISEPGDPSQGKQSVAMITPEFGGNLTVHLPNDLDLSLGSVLNSMKSQDDTSSTAKIFLLGLTWTPNTGLTPITESLTP